MLHPKGIKSPEGRAMVARVRGVVSGFPEVAEAVDKFGHTSFRVRDKPFLILGEGAKGPSLSIKTDPYLQQRLIDRGLFTKTRYIDHHGWVSAVEVPPKDWEQVDHLIAVGYELVAPKGLVRGWHDADDQDRDVG